MSEQLQVAREAMAAAEKGNVEPLLSRDGERTEKQLFEQAVPSVLGLARPNYEILAVLGPFHLMRAAAEVRPQPLDLFAATALLAIALAADRQAPEHTPAALLAAAGTVAEQIGDDLRPLHLTKKIVAGIENACRLDHSVSRLGKDLIATVSSKNRPAAIRLIDQVTRVIETLGDDVQPLARKSGAPTPEQADRAQKYASDGLHQCQLFDLTGDVQQILRGINLLRAAEVNTPDQTKRARIQGNLGTALSQLDRHRPDLAILDEAIEFLTLAGNHPGLTNGEQTVWTLDAANRLQHRFDRSANPSDLDAAIDLVRAVIQSEPGRPIGVTIRWRSELALLLGKRLQVRRTDADADEMLTLSRTVLAEAPDSYPDLPGLRSNLGEALAYQAELLENGDHAAEAVEQHREALRTMPRDHPYRVRMAANLCRALVLHARLADDPTQLHQAVVAAVQAVRTARPDPELVTLADQLVLATVAQAAESTQSPGDLKQMLGTIRKGQQSKNPPLSPLVSTCAAGTLLRARYRLTGKVTDLNAAIADLEPEVRAGGESWLLAAAQVELATLLRSVT
ncbi:MAG TPA: hypothetical protein VLL08_06860 [Kineosporiaceae bacterium]|nr:hypothetical protein [Kineosporiaceae bacterium]